MVKVLVLAATGKQGGATVRALLASKGQHSVRVLVRDASSAKAQALAALGAEVVVGGDWATDVAALDKALSGGIEAVFFVSVPSFTDLEVELKGATNVVEAAKRAGSVRHVLYSSVGSLDKYQTLKGWDRTPFFANYWIAKAKTEDLVKNGGFEHYTILRPTEFMSNYTGDLAHFQVPDLIKEGVLHTALPASYLLSEIDVDDIGRVASAAIAAPSTFASGRRELHLTGEVLSLGEIVAQLSAVLGKQLRVSTWTREEALEALKTREIVAGQLMRLDSDWPNPPADDFGLGFKTFRQHLEEHKDEIRELYKAVP
ncbi:putative nad dependent epimerase protein [Daldinia childiae]|uniref:putative nad dependent epimerase protein n=1 Tax=Daldinia childiae TaxID=326645 RepID=UPI0014450358|nr:putative nad dependent epimerase protein [Daldinia childiae]KAF3064465.1 putative nad dependent epimerase protein [Daldinia childiae]